MTATNLGALLVAVALLTKTNFFDDILPVTPPTPPPGEFNDRPICGTGERLVYESGNWVCIPKL